MFPALAVNSNGHTELLGRIGAGRKRSLLLRLAESLRNTLTRLHCPFPYGEKAMITAFWQCRNRDEFFAHAAQPTCRMREVVIARSFAVQM